MSLTPTLNAGLYTIQNVGYGGISVDRSSLAATGTSGDAEVVWQVSINQDSSYTFTVVTAATTTSITTGNPASPGSVDTDDSNLRYISVNNAAQATEWALKPILTGSNPPISFVIYLVDAQSPTSHWELLSNDETERVKLSKDPNQEENKIDFNQESNTVPSSYSPQALWNFLPYTPPN